MPVVYLVGGCLTCCSSYRLSFNVITIYGVVCVQLARLRWPNGYIYRLCHYHHQSGSINKDFFNTIVQFMLSSNSRIRFGLQIAFAFLYKTPSHYHHCANLSEEIELIKYLSDIFCRVCKIKHILSVIHYAIYGAVCYQFVYPPCDDWDNIYYLMMIIRQSIYSLKHYKKDGQTDNKSGLTTAPIGSQSKNLTTRQLICGPMVSQKQLCSPFRCVLSRRCPKNCRLGKAIQCRAWRHLNFTWKFQNLRKGNSNIKHHNVVPSTATRVYFDSDCFRNFGRLKYIFF